MVNLVGSVHGVAFAGKQMEQLSFKIRRRVVRDALRSAVRPIVSAAKREAPRQTGELKRGIGSSISVRRYVTEARVGMKKTSKARFYAHLVEFGTAHSAAKPFLRPAWDVGRQNAARILTKRMQEVAAQQAAKARSQRA